MRVVPSEPRAEAVRAAAAVLREGEVVALPTDTVYGIAALPTVEGATAGLFRIKGRPGDVPIAVLCADLEQALELSDAADHPTVRCLGDRFWPGALTVVTRRAPGLVLALGEPETTVGLRCPDDGFVQALAREVGPLATTSANRHGSPALTDAGAVARDLGGGVVLVVDGGRRAGVPSTVVDVTGARPVVVREGSVSEAAVERALAGGG
jgi:tRNA threonylcarbamoyl adenosine modification protein (Sua5/YciO/YrdC/YwlC family)